MNRLYSARSLSPDSQPHASAEDLLSTLQSLRHTSPRLITSPPTQPRRASVALIVRMRPAPSLVFEGYEPDGWTGEVIPKSEWGLGLNLEDFFRLRRYPSVFTSLRFSFSPLSTSWHGVLRNLWYELRRRLTSSLGPTSRYHPRTPLHPPRLRPIIHRRPFTLVKPYRLPRRPSRAKRRIRAVYRL